MKSQCLKYSGAKLHEKGILVSIQDLPTHQYKNVLFEIRPTESNGVFSVCGKFMGVEMETIEINIQVDMTKQQIVVFITIQFVHKVNMKFKGFAR